jgi:hypothetical protein
LWIVSTVERERRGRARERDEAHRVVGVVAPARSVERLPVEELVAPEEHELDAVALEADRLEAEAVERTLHVDRRTLGREVLRLLHGRAVAREDDGHLVPRARERRRQRPEHVREPSRLGERLALGRDVQDVHGRSRLSGAGETITSRSGTRSG